jgi:Ribosome-associated heat shock protein implicated in the recycling of the 50S subunit (S4 paralog)
VKPPDPLTEDVGWQRLDKFMFHARLAKSRSIAASLIGAGCVRINRQITEKPTRNSAPAMSSPSLCRATCGSSGSARWVSAAVPPPRRKVSTRSWKRRNLA